MPLSVAPRAIADFALSVIRNRGKAVASDRSRRDFFSSSSPFTTGINIYLVNETGLARRTFFTSFKLLRFKFISGRADGEMNIQCFSKLLFFLSFSFDFFFVR